MVNMMFLSVACLSLTFDTLLVSASSVRRNLACKGACKRRKREAVAPRWCDNSTWNNNTIINHPEFLKDPNATVPALRCNFGHKPFFPEDPDKHTIGCSSGPHSCTCMSEAQAIAHNQSANNSTIIGGAGLIIFAVMTLGMVLYCGRSRKPVMQKVENSNKVNAVRGETLESSAQNGSTEMVPVDAAAHDENIEDAILHNPEDVNEEAEKGCSKKEKIMWLLVLGGAFCLFFFGGITLLVFGILGSTDAYVSGC